MIVISGIAKIIPHAKTEAHEAALEMPRLLKLDPGCLSYELSELLNEPYAFRLPVSRVDTEAPTCDPPLMEEQGGPQIDRQQAVEADSYLPNQRLSAPMVTVWKV